jgi:hypothetical protein
MHILENIPLDIARELASSRPGIRIELIKICH